MRLTDSLDVPSSLIGPVDFLENVVEGGVGSLTESLTNAQLTGVVESPLYEPLANGVVLYATAMVSAFVVKLVLKIALLPVLSVAGSNTFLSADTYELGRKLGGGSYGAVFEGQKASDSEASVVIKTPGKDPRANEFALAELQINQKLTLCGQAGRMASFQGHYIDGGVTLVHKLEGSTTLDQALQSKTFPMNVEELLTGKVSEIDRGDADATLAKRTMLTRKLTSQLFDNLAGIHGWDVVHRDIKGANLILSESARRIKIIDFGAACDLFSRTNLDSTLQVFDPSYCPPEAPPSEGGLVASAGGRFDVFSAGLVLVQMCFPQYRSAKGIAAFKKSLDLQDWQLKKWREAVEGNPGYAEGFEILDAAGGFGLLEACLRRDPNRRISSAAAARHGFCRVF